MENGAGCLRKQATLTCSTSNGFAQYSENWQTTVFSTTLACRIMLSSDRGVWHGTGWWATHLEQIRCCALDENIFGFERNFGVLRVDNGRQRQDLCRHQQCLRRYRIVVGHSLGKDTYALLVVVDNWIHRRARDDGHVLFDVFALGVCQVVLHQLLSAHAQADIELAAVTPSVAVMVVSRGVYEPLHPVLCPSRGERTGCPWVFWPRTWRVADSGRGQDLHPSIADYRKLKHRA